MESCPIFTRLRNSLVPIRGFAQSIEENFHVSLLHSEDVSEMFVDSSFSELEMVLISHYDFSCAPNEPDNRTYILVTAVKLRVIVGPIWVSDELDDLVGLLLCEHLGGGVHPDGL